MMSCMNELILTEPVIGPKFSANYMIVNGIEMKHKRFRLLNSRIVQPLNRVRCQPINEVSCLSGWTGVYE